MRDDIDLHSESAARAARTEGFLDGLPQTSAEPAFDAALSALVGAAPILVLAPHPDAETLGCGALLAACFAERDAAVVCVTDGRRSHRHSADWPGPLLAALRLSEARDAVARLGGGADDLISLGFEDGRAPMNGPDFDVAVETVIRLCEARGAESLFAPFDAGSCASCAATTALARAVAARRPELRLFLYPIWSRLRNDAATAAPDGAVLRRFPAGDWRAAKRSAIAAHRSQLGLVVSDDPSGFILPEAVIERLLTEDEIFYEQRA